MNNKITAVALCLAMVCTFVLIDASDEAEAVEQTIVEVSSGEELAEAMKNRYDLTNYQGEGGYISTVTASPVTIVFTQDITLDDDSGFSSRYSGEWEVTPYFTGTIDGRGHSLITNFSKDTHYLAESTLGDVVVKDINIICEGHTFSFFYRSGVAANVYVDQPVNVSFEDITVERFPDVGNNCSAFTIQAANSTVNFTNCINEASYNINGYAAIFLGGMAVGNVNLNFKGCVNNGAVSSNSEAYMFIGNNSNGGYAQTISVTIDENCKNNGLITAPNAALFDSLGNNPNFVALNNQFQNRTDLTNNIVVLEELDVNASYESGTNKIVLGGVESGYTYSASMLVYIVLSGGAGTNNLTLEFPLTEDVYAGWFLDKNTASQKYNYDVSGDYTSAGAYSYKILQLDDGQRVYIVDLGIDSDSAKLEAKPTVRISGYDNTGALVGTYVMPGISTTLVPASNTFLITFGTGMVEYTNLYAGGNIAREGDTFIFSVEPFNGYRIVGVYANNTQLTEKDGTYSFVVYEETTISVETERMAYSVTLNLNNISIDNTVQSVDFNGSYTATLTAQEGYEISRVSVIMGGQELEVSGNVINIPVVTGNLIISAWATEVEEDGGSDLPFPPIWDDDDEYIPPIVPVQPQQEEDDDTVTIVACAAAAVVAALLAAFLIIDRKH